MGLITRIKRHFANSRNRNAVERAKDIFQITEYQAQIWFVCNGTLLFPCSLIADKDTTPQATDVTAFLAMMRQLYVERHKA